MLEDTAVLDQVDTVSEDSSTPPEMPEIALEDLLPETGAGEEEPPETEQQADQPVRSDDDLKNDPQVKALLDREMKSLEARLNESARRRAENAAKQAEQKERERKHSEEISRIAGSTGSVFLSNVSRTIAQTIEADVRKWMEESTEGNYKVDPRKVHTAVTASVKQVVDGVTALAVDEGSKIFDGYRRKEFADYKPDEADISALKDAETKKDFRAVGAIRAAILLKAQIAREEPKIREDERKKVLAELRQQAEAKKATQAATTRQERPRPTIAPPNGAGAGAPRLTIAEIERLGVNGLRNRYPDPQERAAVLAEARNHAIRQVQGNR